MLAKPRSLQRRFLLLVGAGLVFLVTLSTAAVAWLQWTQLVYNVDEFSENELESLHALIVEAMAMRVNDVDDIGVSVFNNWFDRRNMDYPGEIWSSWSPQVRQYMADLEPDRTPKLPRDEVDDLALARGETVARMEGDFYRVSLPIVLGKTTGADQEVCHGCHGAMGLQDGDVIAVLSSSLSLAEERQRLETILLILFGCGAAAIVIGLLALRWTLIRSVTGPVTGMTAVMRRLAQGDTDVKVEGADRSDEIGEMAAAVSVFRENAVARQALEAEQAEVARQREARLAKMQQLVARFEESVARVMASVTGSTETLTQTAQSMTTTAKQASDGSDQTARGAEGASTSVQVVSAAAEQLSASFSQISGEIARSHEMSTDAVATAGTSRERVHQLEKALARIADISGQIKSIANQTNLLALNATIEAARAGESGRGFVVVASEIKQLARHTLQATVDIGECVQEVTDGTSNAIAAVEAVVERINRIDERLGVIADTVNQQQEATQEIAHSCERAAVSTADVADGIKQVANTLHVVDTASHQVSEVVQSLGAQADDLQGEVRYFLTGLKAA